MATTTASKSGLRAAATARTARAAQRTPLPPKPGVVEDAREAVAEVAAERKARATKAAPAKSLGKRMVEHAAEEAPAAPRKPRSQRAAEAHNAAVESHEQKIRAGQERKRAARAAQDAVEAVVVEEAPATTPRKATKKAPSSKPADPKPAPVEETKATRHVAHFEAHGWTVVVQTDGPWTELVATRGSEVIHQGWLNGVYDHDRSGTYHYGDRLVRTRNVAEARRWAERAQAEAAKQFTKVVDNRSFRRKPAELEPVKFSFDPATVTEAELIEALRGRRVTWHNRYRQEPETAHVQFSPSRFNRLDTNAATGERTFLFCDPGFGFRAFRLTDLRTVSRTAVKDTPPERMSPKAKATRAAKLPQPRTDEDQLNG